MLEEMATTGDESIVSWQPHGKAFRVHQPDAFFRTVMPRYFKQTKYKSFQRQLHIYGFHRITKGMDTGAYFHCMFVRNKKSMSLRMACQKIKGKKSSNAVGHHAAVDPDFYSSEIKNVDNDQYQDRHNLKNMLRADSILQTATTIKKEKSECRSKLGPATAFTTGCSDQHHNHPADEETPLVKSALLFNEEVLDGLSPSHQPIGSEIGLVDWMEHAQTILSRDEELASTYQGYESCSAFEKDHDVLALLCGVNHQKHDDEGLFEGKRFFCVEETKTAPPLVEDFSAVINRRGPMFYMPRSA
jgi:hypothetical protein